ncbi:MAG: Fur family transcriptional regulator [Candidatus Faecivicinus sp.]
MRGEYSTRQKRELLRFLKDHNLENFSVDEVTFRLQDEGTQIGRSTVYRYLESLAEQGTVRKYQNAQGMTQYQHIEDEARCANHFHMMCKRCGALLHVDCGLMQSLTAHIAEEHGFALDPRETVLVGVCARCSGMKKEEETCDGTDHTEGCHHCL